MLNPRWYAKESYPGMQNLKITKMVPDIGRMGAWYTADAVLKSRMRARGQKVYQKTVHGDSGASHTSQLGSSVVCDPSVTNLYQTIDRAIPTLGVADTETIKPHVNPFAAVSV